MAEAAKNAALEIKQLQNTVERQETIIMGLRTKITDLETILYRKKREAPVKVQKTHTCYLQPITNPSYCIQKSFEEDPIMMQLQALLDNLAVEEQALLKKESEVYENDETVTKEIEDFKKQLGKIKEEDGRLQVRLDDKTNFMRKRDKDLSNKEKEDLKKEIKNIQELKSANTQVSSILNQKLSQKESEKERQTTLRMEYKVQLENILNKREMYENLQSERIKSIADNYITNNEQDLKGKLKIIYQQHKILKASSVEELIKGKKSDTLQAYIRESNRILQNQMKESEKLKPKKNDPSHEFVTQLLDIFVDNIDQRRRVNDYFEQMVMQSGKKIEEFMSVYGQYAENPGFHSGIKKYLEAKKALATEKFLETKEDELISPEFEISPRRYQRSEESSRQSENGDPVPPASAMRTIPTQPKDGSQISQIKDASQPREASLRVGTAGGGTGRGGRVGTNESMQSNRSTGKR